MRLSFFTENEGLPSRQISSLIFDTENNLWLSTKKSGILRLKYSNFTNITEDEGLSLNRVNSLLAERDGVYLVGTDNGSVDKIEGDKITHLEFGNKLDNVSIKDLMYDSKGALWLATYAGVIKKTNTSETLYSEEDGLAGHQARVLHEDQEGNIWVGFKNSGIAKMPAAGRDKALTFDRSNGLGANYILSIEELEDGTILVGTHSGGLNFIKGDSIIDIQYPAKLGAGVLIFNTYVENSMRIWLATNIGIFLYKINEKTFTQISEINGLKAETIFDITQDDDGFFWITSNVGIIRVAVQQLLNFTDGVIDKIEAMKFDHNDGLISNECTAAAKSLVISKNEIWFPTLGGIAIVDPTSLIKSDFVPPVFIKSLCLDDDCEEAVKSDFLVLNHKLFSVSNINDEICLDGKPSFSVKNSNALSLSLPNPSSVANHT